nr:hypothetical protein BaRGS_025994 [Batillaria attramentaria]
MSLVSALGGKFDSSKRGAGASSSAPSSDTSGKTTGDKSTTETKIKTPPGLTEKKSVVSLGKFGAGKDKDGSPAAPSSPSPASPADNSARAKWEKRVSGVGGGGAGLGAKSDVSKGQKGSEGKAGGGDVQNTGSTAAKGRLGALKTTDKDKEAADTSTAAATTTTTTTTTPTSTTTTTTSTGKKFPWEKSAQDKNNKTATPTSPGDKVGGGKFRAGDVSKSPKSPKSGRVSLKTAAAAPGSPTSKSPGTPPASPSPKSPTPPATPTSSASPKKDGSPASPTSPGAAKPSKADETSTTLQSEAPVKAEAPEPSNKTAAENRAEKGLKDASDARDKATKELADKEKALKDLQAKSLSLKIELEAREDVLKEELAAKQQQLEDLRQKQNAQEDELTQLRDKLAAMEKECQQLREEAEGAKRVAAVQGQREEWEKTLTELRTQVNAMEEQCSRLEGDNQSLLSKLRVQERQANQVATGDDNNGEVTGLQGELRGSEMEVEDLRSENVELREELADLRREMDEMYDTFRENELDEFRELQRELDLTAKNCRVLQFKLRKSERRGEQVDKDRQHYEEKLRSLQAQFESGDARSHIEALEEELRTAKEVSVRLHDELDIVEDRRNKALEENRHLTEILEQTDKKQFRLEMEIDKLRDQVADLKQQLRERSPTRKEGTPDRRDVLGRQGSQEYDSAQLMRDLCDSVERETDLKEQLKFVEEESRMMRRKLAEMEDENEALRVQLKKLSLKASRWKEESESRAHSQEKKQGKDESGHGTERERLDSSDDETSVVTLKLQLALLEQELMTSKRAQAEAEKDAEKLQEEVTSLHLQLKEREHEASARREPEPPASPDAYYEEKVRDLTAQADELRWRIIEKDRELERLSTASLAHARHHEGVAAGIESGTGPTTTAPSQESATSGIPHVPSASPPSPARVQELLNEAEEEKRVLARKMAELQEANTRLKALVTEKPQGAKERAAMAAKGRRVVTVGEGESREALMDKILDMEEEINDLLLLVKRREEEVESQSREMTSLRAELQDAIDVGRRTELQLLKEMDMLHDKNTVLSNLLDIVQERANEAEQELERYVQVVTRLYLLSTLQEMSSPSTRSASAVSAVSALSDASCGSDEVFLQPPSGVVGDKGQVIHRDWEAKLKNRIDSLERLLAEERHKVTMAEKKLNVSSAHTVAPSVSDDVKLRLREKELLQEELAESQHHLRLATDQVRGMKERLHALEEEYHRLKVDYGKLCSEHEVARYKLKSEQLEYKVEEISDIWRSKSAATEKEKQALERQLKDKASEISQLGETLQRLQQDLKAKDSELSKMAALKEELEQEVTRRDAAETELHVLVTQAADREQLLRELRETVRTRDERLKEKDDIIHYLNACLEQRQKEAEQLQQRMKGVTSQQTVTSSTDGSKEAGGETDVEKENARLRETTRALREELAQGDATRQEAEKSRRSLEVASVGWEKQKAEMQASLNIAEEKLRLYETLSTSSTETAMEGLKKESIKYFEEKESLNAQVTSLRHELATCQKSARETTLRLQQDINSKLQQLKEESEANQRLMAEVQRLRAQAERAYRVQQEERLLRAEHQAMKVRKLLVTVDRLQKERQADRELVAGVQKAMTLIRDAHAQDQMRWEEEKARLDNQIKEVAETQVLAQQLKQKITQLREELGEQERARADVINKFSTERAAWEIDRANLRSKINQLEEQLGRTKKNAGGTAAMETAWAKERAQQQRLLAEAHDLALDLQRQLQSRDQEATQNQRQLAEKFEADRQTWEKERQSQNKLLQEMEVRVRRLGALQKHVLEVQERAERQVEQAHRERSEATRRLAETRHQQARDARAVDDVMTGDIIKYIRETLVQISSAAEELAKHNHRGNGHIRSFGGLSPRTARRKFFEEQPASQGGFLSWPERGKTGQAVTQRALQVPGHVDPGEVRRVAEEEHEWLLSRVMDVPTFHSPAMRNSTSWDEKMHHRVVATPTETSPAPPAQPADKQEAKELPLPWETVHSLQGQGHPSAKERRRMWKKSSSLDSSVGSCLARAGMQTLAPAVPSAFPPPTDLLAAVKSKLAPVFGR